MNLVDPTADLPDDTFIDRIRLPTRLRNALSYGGVRTIGEIREAPDATLRSFPDLGKGSVQWLRDKLG